MAEKKLRRATGSSANLRAHMNEHFVIVHDVSSNVSFEKYLQFARGSFDNAVRLYNKKDYNRAYVDFTKFQKFVEEKLPAHQGYDGDNERTEKAKNWLSQASEAAAEFVEEISFQLDVIEDIKQNPNSRATFMTEMQKHEADIFVPDWFEADSDDEEGKHSRSRSHHSPTQHPQTAYYQHIHSHTHSPYIDAQHSSQGQQIRQTTLKVSTLPPHLRTEFPAQSYPSPQHMQHLPPALSISTSPHSGRTSHSAHSPHVSVAGSPYSAHGGHVQSYPSSPHAHLTLHSGSPHHAPAYPSSPHAQPALHAGSPHHAPAYPSSPHAQPVQHSGSLHHAPAYPSIPHAHPAHNSGSPHHNGHVPPGGSYLDSPRTHTTARTHSPKSKYVLPGVTQEDASIMNYYRCYAQFDIPAPTINECSIRFKRTGQQVFHFEQHDFHISYTPFLRALPVELQLCRSAVEVNRCFFIHLGVATQYHPFALQTYFRYTAAADCAEEADWERELAKTLTEYAGCVDANVLQYTWPANFDKYRILLVSGPSEDPLLTCFLPSPHTRTRALADLYEIIIRNDRDHYTLLRPIAHTQGKIKVIDRMLEQAKLQGSVVQECEVASRPGHNIDTVLTQL